MRGMDVRTWTTISRLLDDALDVPPAERESWLDGLSAEHAALLPRLRELLSQAGQIERDAFLATLPKLHEVGPLTDAGTVVDASRREGASVGPYRLVRAIASGGQAAVWLAERADGVLTRPVALKLPHGLAFRPGLAERMVRERNILAGLAHPNIARLYDAGVTETGEPYLALEYVDGRPIHEHCAERALSVPDRVCLFLQVVRAVAYAHGQLVIHRDLKPSNVLVTSHGSVRLLDFGIAKLLRDEVPVDSTLTLDAGRALTLPYASPEQVQHHPLGVATDIYSLGVVLYELLTGSRPYRPARESAAALEEAILRGEVPCPSLVAPVPARRALQGDLDTILLKALKKSPGERYATAEALADDLERALDGRPVLAQPDSRAYRLKKFIGRHTAGVVVTAASLATVLTGFGLAVWQADVARGERDRAVVQQLRARASKDLLMWLLQQADPRGSVSPIELLARGAAQLEVSALGDDVVAYLQYELADHFVRFNLTGPGIELTAKSAVRAERAGDLDLAAGASCLGAWLQAPLDVDQAQGRLTDGLRLYAATATPTFRTHVDCLLGRSRLLHAQGRAREAISLLESDLPTLALDHENDWMRRSLVKSQLADFYRQDQRLGDALRLTEDSLEELRRHGQTGTLTEFTGLNNVAFLLHQLGEVRAAHGRYLELLAWRDRAGVAVPPLALQLNASATELRLGRPREALAFALAERTAAESAVNPAFVARSNLAASKAYLALNQTAQATAHLDLAEAFFVTNPAGNALPLVDAAIHRAAIVAAAGDREGALARIDAVLAELGYPGRLDRRYLDRGLRLAARLHLERGAAAAAEPLATSALDIARRDARDAEHSADVGEAALLRAQARAALGRALEALADARLAVQSLSAGLGPAHASARDAQNLVGALAPTSMRH